MSQAVRNDSGVDRNQPRMLTYRPHLKWTFYILLNAAVALAVMTPIAAFLLLNEGRDAEAIGLLVIGILAPVALFIQSWFVIRPMVHSSVQVYGDHLCLKQLNGEINIPFPEIKRVAFRHIPYLVGWFTLTTQDNKNFRFNVALERSEYILDALAKFKGDLIDRVRWEEFRRTAVASDHSWARFHSRAIQWPTIALKYVVFPALLTAVGATQLEAFDWDVLNRMHWLNFVVVANIGLTFFMIEEIYYSAVLHKNLSLVRDSVRRDMAAEKKLHLKFQAAFYAACVCAYLWYA